jgi:hypothetical protein
MALCGGDVGPELMISDAIIGALEEGEGRRFSQLSRKPGQGKAGGDGQPTGSSFFAAAPRRSSAVADQRKGVVFEAVGELSWGSDTLVPVASGKG